MVCDNCKNRIRSQFWFTDEVVRSFSLGLVSFPLYLLCEGSNFLRKVDLQFLRLKIWAAIWPISAKQKNALRKTGCRSFRMTDIDDFKENHENRVNYFENFTAFSQKYI